jgi:hypothetical protein
MRYEFYWIDHCAPHVLKEHYLNKHLIKIKNNITQLLNFYYITVTYNCHYNWQAKSALKTKLTKIDFAQHPRVQFDWNIPFIELMKRFR